MAIQLTDGSEEVTPLDYVSLYFRLCNCAGPQPSRYNPRLDEHDRQCPYRREVEHDSSHTDRR